MDAAQQAKDAASREALEAWVSNDMRIGLGSGSTAESFVRLLGERVQSGSLFLSCCVASSRKTESLARRLSLSLASLEEAAPLDLLVDGADEIDESLRMVKGGGGCLLREKILAHCAQKMIVVVDESKVVERLGSFPLPIEVAPFAWRITARQVSRLLEKALGHRVLVLARGGDARPLETDNGNYTLDCHCGILPHPEELELALNAIPGVAENGLFPNTADVCIVGRQDGNTRVLLRPSPSAL